MPRSEDAADPSTLARQTADALSLAIRQIHHIPVQEALASLHVRGVILELMARLLVLMEVERQVSPPPADEHPCAGTARAILMDNLANPPSIEDLARQVGLSQRRLNEVFRQAFGAAPSQCLKTWRLEQARRLLARGDLSVKQVAHRMGYAHVSSFTHAYTRCFSTPPSQEVAHGKDA